MNYWIVWPVGIALWLALGWAAFAWFESRALKHDARKDQITLSMFCYTIGSKFPLSILLAGLIIGIFIGGLGVHFLWHWCPPGSVNVGFLERPISQVNYTLRCLPISPGSEAICAQIEREKR